MNYTAKMRHRLQRSPSGKDLLNAKQRLRELRLLSQSQSPQSGIPASPRGSPSIGSRRHTRRDDIELRDLPRGYSGSSSPSGKIGGDRPRTSTLDGGSPSTSTLPVTRGIQKAYSTDDAGATKRGARRSLPGRLQRQGGLNKVAILNSTASPDGRPPTLKEFTQTTEGGTLHSQSLRNSTLSRGGSSIHPTALLSKSASTSAAGVYSSTTETSSPPRDSSSRASPSTLLQRLADPFARTRPQSGGMQRVNPSDVKVGDSVTLNIVLPRLSINSSAGTDGERDSFDSRDNEGCMHISLSGCSSMDSADCHKAPPPKALSPSVMYQRLLGGVPRDRTHSSDSWEEDGCASPAALRRSSKGRAPSSPMAKQSSRIVPINITADLENDLSLRTRPVSGGNIGGVALLNETNNNNNNNNNNNISSGSFIHTDGQLGGSNDHVNLSGLSSKGPPLQLQHQQQLLWMKQKSMSPSHNNNRNTSSSHRLQMPRGFPVLHLNISQHDMTTGCQSHTQQTQDSPYAVSDLVSPDMPTVTHRGSGGYFPKPSTPLSSSTESMSAPSPSGTARRNMPNSPCNPRLMHSTSVVRSLSSSCASPSGGGSVRHRRFDTMGDIARKYNIDPTSPSAASSGEGAAVPRYAQSTIKSQIRGSIVQSDKANFL